MRRSTAATTCRRADPSLLMKSFSNTYLHDLLACCSFRRCLFAHYCHLRRWSLRSGVAFPFVPSLALAGLLLPSLSLLLMPRLFCLLQQRQKFFLLDPFQVRSSCPFLSEKLRSVPITLALLRTNGQQLLLLPKLQLQNYQPQNFPQPSQLQLPDPRVTETFSWKHCPRTSKITLPSANPASGF